MNDQRYPHFIYFTSKNIYDVLQIFIQFIRSYLSSSKAYHLYFPLPIFFLHTHTENIIILPFDITTQAF